MFKIRVVVRTFPRVLFALLFLGSISGCRKPGANKAARAMVVEIERQIQQQVPVGSDQGKVASFVSAQQWNYQGFEPTKEGTILKVWIPGIPSGVLYCDATGRLLVTFLFDRHGKLVSHTSDQVHTCW